MLVEDHHVVRDGIRFLLEKQDNIRVVDEALNGAQAIEMVQRGNVPDLIITDINMPDMDGVMLIRQLKKIEPSLKIMVLSMLDHEKYISTSFQAGGIGYLLKNVTSQELLFAINHVMSGHEYICAEIATRFLQRMLRAPVLSKTGDTAAVDLSERDLEILHLVSEGYTNEEIANKLLTSKRTVEGFRQQLLIRTGTRNTAALVRFAALNGLLN